MSRSSALAVEGRGLPPGKSPASILAHGVRVHRQLLHDLATHPCAHCMSEARTWHGHLQEVAATSTALAFSPVLSLAARQVRLTRAREYFGRLRELLDVLASVPAAARAGFTAQEPADIFLSLATQEAFALGATLDRARAELRALARAERTALTPPAPAKRRALSETT